MKAQQLVPPIVAIMLLSSLCSISVANAAISYSDEFNNPSLDSKWTFTDPDGGSTISLTDNPGWLRITTSANRDLVPAQFNSPRLSQQVTGDFTVETKIDATTVANDEGAGILVWIDQNDFIRLDRMSRTIGYPVQQQVIMGGLSSGSLPPWTVVVLDPTVNPTYLKLEKIGATFTGWYSSDGTTWNTVGTATIPMADPVNVGIDVINMFHSGDFYADFDYFRLTQTSTFPAPESPLGALSAVLALMVAFAIIKIRKPHLYLK